MSTSNTQSQTFGKPEMLTGRHGLRRPIQDGPLKFIAAEIGDLRTSPRATLLEKYLQGKLDTIFNRAKFDDREYRKQFIFETMQAILDMKGGRGSVFFSSSGRAEEVENVMKYVWDGVQDVVAHLAGGDLNFATECLNDFIEVTTSFITPRPYLVTEEMAKQQNFKLQVEKPKKATKKKDVAEPDPAAVERGEVVVMQAVTPQEEPKYLTQTVGEGDGAQTYYVTEAMLPRDMQAGEGEFMVTTLSRLLTTGPLVRTLLYHISKERQVKSSAQLQPVWEKVVTSLRNADGGIIGNWLANVRPEHVTPRAGRMIIQWATSMLNATRMAEEVTSESTDVMDKVITGLTAQTEFFPGVIIDPGKDSDGSQVLREYIMQMFNNVSRAGIIEALASVIGDPEVETSNGEWLKELTKVLRDSGYDPKQTDPANMKANDGEALGHVKMSHMQTGAVPISGDARLRNTIAKALCGTVATYPPASTGEIVKMSLPQMLVLEPRKAKTPGRPMLMMTEETTTPDQRARMSEYLLNQVDILISLVGHANMPDKGMSPGETLNFQQRVATLLTLWSHMLAARPNEPMDSIKDQARSRFLGMSISWHFSGHQSELITNAFEQSLRVIGMRWPEQFLQSAVQQAINRGPTVGTDTRRKTKKFMRTIGIIHPDLSLNLGKAAGTISVGEVEAETESSGKSKAKTKIEMKIQPEEVYTAARPFIVAGEAAFLTDIKAGTHDISHDERKMSQSVLGALSDLSFIYEIGVLAQDGSVEATIALSHALRAYNTRHGIRRVDETAHYFAAIDRVISTSQAAGVDYTMPANRMGNRMIQNPSKLPDLTGKSIQLAEDDVARVTEYATNVFTHAESLLGDSLDIVDAYAVQEERTAIAQVIGKQLKEQLARILQNQEAPHSYGKLIAALNHRISEIEKRVRTVGRAAISAESIFDMGAGFEEKFAEQIQALEHTTASQLITTAREKEEALRKELNIEIGKIFTSEALRVKTVGDDRLRLAKEIMQTVLSPVGMSASGNDVQQLMTLFGATKPKDGTPDELGDLLNKALTMVGAGGLGYAIGASRGAGMAPAVELAKSLQNEGGELAHANVQTYEEVARVKRDVLVRSLEHIYAVRMQYYRDIMEKALQVNAQTIAKGLDLELKLVGRQYADVERTIDSVFGITKQLVDIRMQGIGLDVKEAQQTLDYIVRYMGVIRPVFRKILNMLDDQWGINIEKEMSGWDHPELVLGIKVDDNFEVPTD